MSGVRSTQRRIDLARSTFHLVSPLQYRQALTILLFARLPFHSPWSLALCSIILDCLSFFAYLFSPSLPPPPRRFTCIVLSYCTPRYIPRYSRTVALSHPDMAAEPPSPLFPADQGQPLVSTPASGYTLCIGSALVLSIQDDALLVQQGTPDDRPRPTPHPPSPEGRLIVY